MAYLVAGPEGATMEVVVTLVSNGTVHPVLPPRAVYQPVGQPPAALQSKVAVCIALG